ncbi:hypothetical protein FAZ21_15725 [Chitiniphilus eburneus]|uniref:DUF6881 domain-containing protein n=1 Tax=Chitiniphilus eburneus TaxID=2571148 RepID=A0A4U0PJY6_9NEIS|nr:hypothetical protein FAZ21_15725 [Chitiniphilus eburneus]
MQSCPQRQYIDVAWLHNEPQEPVRLVSELNEARNELRKLEIFRDGKALYASEHQSSGDIGLSIEPIPTLEEINEDPQFKGCSITAEAFQALWQQHVRPDA